MVYGPPFVFLSWDYTCLGGSLEGEIFVGPRELGLSRVGAPNVGQFGARFSGSRSAGLVSLQGRVAQHTPPPPFSPAPRTAGND